MLSFEDELPERVPVERRQEQVADPDVELDRLDVGLARGARGFAVLLDEERAYETAAEISQRQALRIEVSVVFADPDDEVDQGLVRAPTIDRERRDPGADDDRESEEALADDLAKRLEAPDPFADALEPAVSAE